MEKKYLSNAERQKAYRQRLKQKAKSAPTESVVRVESAKPPTAVESAPATFHELCKQAFEALAALTRPEPPQSVKPQPSEVKMPTPGEKTTHFQCVCEECRARYQAGYMIADGVWIYTGVVSPTKAPSAVNPRYGDRDWGSAFKF